VDTNVLVFAHRAGAPLHRSAQERLRELVEGDAPWAMPVFVIGEFCRVVTHPRILTPPTDLDVALEVIDHLLAGPNVRLLVPGPRYPELFHKMCVAADARGNLAFDAQIAAVCQEHGATRILTADRDFARFPGLTCLAL
jgi:toxin-antitoxin system PIN domain toxin